LLRVGQDVHQVGDRRALIAADVADAGLQQRLGDGENAFAAELLPAPEPQLAYFMCKRSFSHGRTRSDMEHAAATAVAGGSGHGRASDPDSLTVKHWHGSNLRAGAGAMLTQLGAGRSRCRPQVRPAQGLWP